MDSWTTNALTGEFVSPAVDWLIDRLAALTAPIQDGCNAHLLTRLAYLADYHAHQIHGHLLTRRHRGDNKAILVGHGRAERIPVTAGPWKGLQRLLRAAQGRSDLRWRTAWLGVPSDVHKLLGWRPPAEGFEVSLRGLHAASPSRRDAVPLIGLHAVMPSRRVAVPLIEAALRKLEATPGRQKRQPDALADDVARAVAVAYRDLTGKRGLYRDEVRGRDKGGLLLLARDIESRFKCEGLFSVRRFEKKP